MKIKRWFMAAHLCTWLDRSQCCEDARFLNYTEPCYHSAFGPHYLAAEGRARADLETLLWTNGSHAATAAVAAARSVWALSNLTELKQISIQKCVPFFVVIFQCKS